MLQQQSSCARNVDFEPKFCMCFQKLIDALNLPGMSADTPPSAPDDVLFTEDPIPRRAARFFSRQVTDLARDVSGMVMEGFRNFGENFMAATARVRAARHPPPPRSHFTQNSQDIVAEYPFVTEIVRFSEGLSPRITREAAVARAARSVDDCLANLTRLFDRINEAQDAIERNRLQLPQSDSFPSFAKTLPTVDVKIADFVHGELEGELLDTHQTVLDDLRTDLMHVMNYIQAFQTERPEAECSIQIQPLSNRLSNFPANFPLAQNLIAQMQRVKIYRRKLARSTTVKPQPSRILERLMSRCEAIFDSQIGYFPISEDNETEFAAALEALPPAFSSAMQDRIDRSAREPPLVGGIVLEQCSDLIRLMNMARDMQRFLFLLFVRHFFDHLYPTFPNAMDPKLDFQSRVFALRKLSPVAFGCTESHIPAPFSSMRLSMFPWPHFYSKAVSQFASLSFTLSPIDFCMAAKVGLELTQEIASQLSFDSNTKRTGQILARTDHSLSLDELFDVSFIIFLLSDPIDVLTLISDFDPFIEGLQVPSTLQFAFSHMKALCEHIMRLDIKAFVREARLRERLSGEVDPLNIMAQRTP
jgi:hypothetical protein